MLHNPKHFLSFGNFTLNATDRVLRHAGNEVKLRPKAFDLLYFFVTHPDNLVNRKELKLAVWPTVNVTDNNVDKRIAEIRNALAEHDPLSEYIQNSPSYGWRFLAPVEEHLNALAPREDVLSDVNPFPRAAVVTGSPKRWLMPSAAAGAVVVFAAVLVAVGPLNAPSEPSVLRFRKLTSDGRPKPGPIVTDGKFVYFAEAVMNVINSAPNPAAVPVMGGDVVSPPTPGEPPGLIWDIARKTGELLYARADPGKAWSSSIWKQNGSGIELVSEHVHPRISPDGRSFAYVADDPVHNEMIIRDLGPLPKIRRVPGHGLFGDPSWCPDGSKLRFGVFDPISENSVIWEVQRDGTNPHPLRIRSDAGHSISPVAWTPDDRYFIYADSGRSQPNWTRLWIQREGPGFGRAEPVLLTNGPVSFEDAVLAPDGSKLFARGVDSSSELAQFDSKRGEFVPFWNGVPAVDVSFSNNGARAAYRRLPEDTLWVSRSDGSERRQLTQPPLKAYQPHWSPDGTRIAFMGQMTNGPSRILVVSSAGGTPQAIMPNDAFDQGVPSWSADGRHLVFGELRLRKSDSEMLIHLFDLTSRTETILPDSLGKWTPRWSPDGRYIVALATDFRSLVLVLFDWQAQRWTTLATGSQIDDPRWSLDSQFVHFSGQTAQGGALFRVRIADAEVERLAMQPISEHHWSGVSPHGSPLVLNSRRIEEIYALDLKLP